MIQIKKNKFKHMVKTDQLSCILKIILGGRFLFSYFIIIIFRGTRILKMHPNFDILVSFLVALCMQYVFSHMRYTISQMRYIVILFVQNIIYSRVNDDHKKKPIFIKIQRPIFYLVVLINLAKTWKHFSKHQYFNDI